MLHILHLRDHRSDFQTQRCVEHLIAQLGSGFHSELRTIGSHGHWRSIAPAVMALRHAPPSDLVHAWGDRALSAAALGTPGKIIFSPDAVLTRRAVRWLRAVMSYRQVHVICPTATMRRALVSRGVPFEQCHLIRPGVEFARIRRRRDLNLRAALGLAIEEYVLLAPGESTKQAAHKQAVWAAAILHELDPRFRLLLWGRGAEVDRIHRFNSRMRAPAMLCIAEQRLQRRIEFEELLPAADLVMNAATGSTATLPIAICMAAGLPIVSTVTYSVSELLEDRHTALMTTRQSPRLIAQRVLQLREDPGMQWSLSDMARTEAFEYFALTRFLDQYRALYRQVAAGDRVELPEPPPGAGLRFHGRG